jgi:hypothetical protein
MSPSQRSGIDAKSIVTSNPDIAFSPLDDEMLAMDERAGYCYSLNVSAARIWSLAGSPTSVGSICAVLCREFTVDPEVCLRDVSELLSEMRAAGLVRVSDDAVD